MAATGDDRLNELRAHMSKHNIGMYIVQTQDEHQSEYTSPADNRRAFISGFTGSAGTAVISQSEAVLATDGRYFLQAEKQLGSQWQLLKQGVKGVPTWEEWAVTHAAGSNIGVDPKLISYTQLKRIYDLLAANGLKSDVLVPVNENLVDLVWGAERPQRSKEPVFELTDDYTGKGFEAKIADLQKEVSTLGGTAIVLTALDEVAWLFNLRGLDIPFNPVFFAYAIIASDGAYLYIDGDKLTEKVRAHLGDAVTLRPYEAVFTDADQFGADLVKANFTTVSAKDKKKLLVTNGGSWALVQALGGIDNVKIVQSPVELAKSVKNAVELKGARVAHERDGVALVRYLAWLEDALGSGAKLSDYEAAQHSLKFRQQMENFQGLSFETISSSGPNAAVIHYSPAKDSEYIVDPTKIYLLDSGGQYLEGTTDTTRTVHFGTPTAAEIKAYTLVLKGHIALARAVFPEGSNGYMLDALARQYLWRYGLDYRHGTGHGLGAFLNVHEGPMRIGFRAASHEHPLKIGNVISNEPGYYEDGSFGIRIENVVVVKEAQTEHNFGGTRFFGFDTITQVPLCRKLIDVKLLNSDEIEWINQYHRQVDEVVSGYLEQFKDDKLASKWLKRETAPL